MDKSPEKIQSMFDEIAGRYDLLNHLFTFNLDKKWRRDIVRKIERDKISKNVLLDLASGTGDLTMELTSLNPDQLYSCDISLKMLEVQKDKLKNKNVIISQADAEKLPYDSESIDVVTIGFGIRNFENLGKALNEIFRVLKKSGLLVILEMFSQPKMKKGIYNIYFSKLIPAIGNRISKSQYAYDYLFNSVNGFYTPEELITYCKGLNFELYHRKNNLINLVNTLYFRK